MITIIEGRSFNQSEVATLVMAKLAHKQFESGKKIISNADLRFKHEKMDNARLIEIMEENKLGDYVLALDRAYLFADSRMSQSALNKLISYAAHSGLDMIITTSTIDNLDNRIRKGCTYRINCGRIHDGKAAVYIINIDEGTRFRKMLSVNNFRKLCDIDRISPYLDSDKLLSEALELTDEDKIPTEIYEDGINKNNEEAADIFV